MKIRKVAIVTLCRSPNFGAFLQAYALQEVLKRKGLEPVFPDIYSISSNIKRYKFIYTRGRKSLNGIHFNYKKHKVFIDAEKSLNIVPKSKEIKYDGIFIGADEVWSVINSSFEIAPEFYGLNIDAFKKFSYAPSVGRSSYKDFQKHPDLISGIEQLDVISVRDSEGLTLVNKLLPEKDVTKALDPTFLFNFKKVEEPISVDFKYVLIYTYGMSKERVKIIRNYANDKKLKLLSAGQQLNWCDYSYNCTPFQFLSLIRKAECVITDTFHGTVFSIQYRKHFVSFGQEKPKVKDILNDVGLNENNVSDHTFSALSRITTEYNGSEEIIDKLISHSDLFIERCVNQIDSEI